MENKAVKKMATGPVTDAAKYHCNYCFADCSGLRVTCGECPDFDACLQCFASGAEMGNHKRDHAYQLMDNGTFNLIVPEWTADEEMLLLDGMEQHGLGNWDDVADHIGTKSDLEAKSHYEEIYLWKNVGKVTLPKKTSDILDHTVSRDGQLSPTLLKTLEPLDIPLQEQQELGYMMYRDDFEREYENESENLVKNLVCNRDDDELETALKLSLTDMYWRVLKERSRWKRIARHYGLITSKHKLIASRRKISKEDREFKDAIRVFAQFLPSYQWEDLVSDRIREKELKSKIKELVRYRRNGIKRMSACQEYEELKLQREKKRETKKRMQVISPPRTTKTSGKQKDRSEKESNGDKKMLEEERVDFKDKLDFDSCSVLLSDKEKQICCAMCLKCSKYMTLKTYMLKEYAARRMNTSFKGKPPPYLTSSLRNSLHEFFMQCGWINN